MAVVRACPKSVGEGWKSKVRGVRKPKEFLLGNREHCHPLAADSAARSDGRRETGMRRPIDLFLMIWSQPRTVISSVDRAI